MEPLRNIKAVTFDVGGTLIDPWPSVGEVYASVAARHGLPNTDPAKLNEQFAAAWRAKTNFDYSRAAWSQLVTTTFGGWLRPGQPAPFFDALYDRFAEPDVWRVHEDVMPAVEGLLSRGLELGLVSNWDERLRPLLQRLKLDRYFRVIAVSHEIGFQKPSPVIFIEAARKFACRESEVLHVGDQRVDDVQGAQQAGLQALLLDRGQPHLAGERLQSLAGLVSILG